MSIKDKLLDLWQRDASAVVHGWLPGTGTTYGVGDSGRRYLQVSCLDLAIRYDRQRLGERRPVLQSLVTWPDENGRIPVSRTLGPSSFTGLHDGSFAQLLQSNVALTGDLPMNEGYVDVVVGLLAAPGEGLLDKATEFLGDLAELTRVPQLTAAASVATKITAGVDKLLGTDETIGLLALQTSIDADGLRDGYYVATNWPAASGSLERLRVTDARLEVLHDDQVWRPAAGFDYFVLEVATTGSHPDRWRQLGSMSKLVKDALRQLAEAVSDDDVAAAGSVVRVAIVEVEFEPNLTVEDRAIAADRIAAAWAEGVERRKVILTKQAGEASGDSDRAEILGKLQSIDLVGADVTKRLALMRERTFG